MVLICKRASGELQTTATWIREFVRNHEDYRQDSVVSETIAHDLVMELKAIGEVTIFDQYTKAIKVLSLRLHRCILAGFGALSTFGRYFHVGDVL